MEMEKKLEMRHKLSSFIMYGVTITSILLYAINVYAQDPISNEILNRGITESFNISPTTVYGFIIFILVILGSTAFYFLIKTNKQYITSLKEDRDRANAALANNTQAMNSLAGKIDDMSERLTELGKLIQQLIFK